MKYRLACATIAAVCFALPVAAQSDWTAYGHDAGQTKYSPLDQINKSNVDKLTRAWVYHMKPAGPASDVLPLLDGWAELASKDGSP